MTAYYNEHDPFAAAWLRELIKAGLIAPGDVDEMVESSDDLCYNPNCHTNGNGALFVSSASVFNNIFYWVKHPVLSDFRPAVRVTTLADSTGCFVMKISPYTKNISGQKFGKLTALSIIDYRGGIYNGKVTRHAYWMCECECGNTREVRGSHLRSGTVTMCHKCSELRRVQSFRLSTGYNPQKSALNNLLSVYKENAKRRNLEFQLTPNRAKTLFDGNCFYCGAHPSSIINSKNKEGEYIYNGIDRLDNTVGYTSENSVSCCPTCNYAKRDMAAIEFINWVNRVYHHQKSK